MGLDECGVLPTRHRELLRASRAPSGRRSNRTDGPNGLISNLASPTSREGRESDQVKMIRRVLPHIRQFIEIRDALAGARALNATFAELLDNRVAGVICVERSGKVVHANSLARAILRHRDGLMQDRDGYLRARLAGRRRASPRPGDTGVDYAHGFGRRRLGGGPAVSRIGATHAARYAGGRPRPRFQEKAASRRWCSSSSQAAKQVADPRDVAAALGLTLAESRVACSTVDGATAREIAATTGRRESTVRELLKRVHVKLGISRRADLVRAVLSIGAIPTTEGLRSQCQEDA